MTAELWMSSRYHLAIFFKQVNVIKMPTWLHCLAFSPLLALDLLAHVHVEMFIMRTHIMHLLSVGPL